MIGPGWAWVTAIAWAAQAVLIRGVVREARPSDVFVLAGVIAGVGALLVTGVRIIRSRAVWALGLADTGLLAGAEVLGVLGLMSFYVALKHAGLARTAAITEFYPALAVLLGWMALGESPTALQLIGLVVAGVGIALVQAGS